MSKNIESSRTAPINIIDLGLVRRNLNDAQRAISSINYSNVWKHVGMVIKCGKVQIETKKSKHGGGVHLQMDVDDSEPGPGNKTVAKITIDEALRQYAGASDPQMKKLIYQVVKGALIKSMNTGWQFQVRDMAPDK